MAVNFIGNKNKNKWNLKMFCKLRYINFQKKKRKKNVFLYYKTCQVYLSVNKEFYTLKQIKENL